MMAKFFEKWSAALVFAILLHLGIIFIFYMNWHEDRTDHIEHKQKFIEETTISATVEKPYLPVKTQAQIITLNTAKKHPISDNTKEKNLSANKENSSKTEGKILNKSLEMDASIPIYEIESETIRHQNLQKNNNSLEKKPNVNGLVSNYSGDVLADVKGDVGLLNIDKPTLSSKSNKERGFDLIKSELEETNEKISDAINQVKKRNQQKIDRIQQQNDGYIHNSENKDLTINSLE